MEFRRVLFRSLDYARRTRIIDASNAAGTESDGTPPKSLVTAPLVKLNQDSAEAVARRIETPQQWETAEKPDVMTLPELLNNRAIQKLLQDRKSVLSEKRVSVSVDIGGS